MSRSPAFLTLLLTCATAAACTGGPGPTEASRSVPVDLRPSFQVDPSLFVSDPIDRIRLVATDAATSELVGSTDVTVNPSEPQWTLSLAVDLGGAPSLEIFIVAELLAGQAAQWSGRLGPITVGAEPLRAWDVAVFRGPLDNLDVTSVAIERAPAQLRVGEVTALAANLTLLPNSDATPAVFWASTDPTVATVTPEGPIATLTGVSAGTTEIVAAAGLASAEFTLEVVSQVPSPVNRTWVGAASSSWDDPNNWTPTGVPAANDDVLTTATTFQPVMSADVTIASLTVQAGGPIDQGGFTLSVTGDLAATGGISNGTTEVTGAGSVLSGTFDRLRVSAPRAISGSVVTVGDLEVRSQLSPAGYGVVVQGSLDVSTGAGELIMDQVGSQVAVYQDATFDGASSTGSLTDGLLSVGGDFTVGNTNAPDAFLSTGTSMFFVESFDQVVTFSNPGPSTQAFADLFVQQGVNGRVVLASDVVVTGGLNAGNATFAQGAASTLIALGTLSLDVVEFDGVPLRLDSSVAPDLHAMDDITFTNMPTNVTQLFIRLPGGFGAGLQVNFPVFETVPDPGTYYIEALNSVPAGTLLQIFLTSPSPSPPPLGAFKADANTELIWP